MIRFSAYSFFVKYINHLSHNLSSNSQLFASDTFLLSVRSARDMSEKTIAIFN